MSTHAATHVVHGDLAQRRTHPNHALVPPLHQTATYTFKNTAELKQYMESKLWGGDPEMAERQEYGRYGNQTIRLVEQHLATLEGAEAALLFPSGMSAITHIMLTILPTGSHVIYTDDCYSKTRQFCREFLRRLGIESSTVPFGDHAALEAAVQPNTRLIVSESPTNPYLRIADLAHIVSVARQHRRIKTMIDATFATPINLRPLEHGIDFVVHSGTKYLAGHNDILAGVVLGSRSLLHGLRQAQGVLGDVIAPQTAYLLQRGLKTLALRVRQQNRTAQAVAELLEKHPAVERVWYPGLASHPDHELAKSLMDGFGGVVSFEVRQPAGVSPLDAASTVVDALQIPLLASSLGGVESLVGQPALMSYYALSTEERAAIGIRDNLIRFAVGIEDERDILADLTQALDTLSAPAATHSRPHLEPA